VFLAKNKLKELHSVALSNVNEWCLVVLPNNTGDKTCCIWLDCTFIQSKTVFIFNSCTETREVCINSS